MTVSETGTAYSGPTKDGTDGRWDWVFRPVTFVTAMALLQILHAVLRPLLTATVGNDHTDHLFFAQTLDAGYGYERPPLYSWLVWLVAQPLGPSVLAVGVVRYSLVFLIHLFAYLSARQLIADRRLQVACGLSPLLLYPIAWRLHEADAEGVLASVLVLAMTWSFLSLLRERALGHYLAFGVSLGLGLLSSGYSGLAAVALFLAAAAEQDARRALFRWPLLLGLLLTLLILLPTLVWALDQGPALLETIERRLNDWQSPQTLNPWYWRAWYGFLNLFVGSFPAWLILGLLFFPSLKPLPRGSLEGGARALLYYGLAILLLTPLAAVVLEIHLTNQFRLYPLTLPLLPMFFRRVEAASLSWTTQRWLLIFYAIVVLIVIQARFQHIEAGPAFCAKCRMQTPYPALAQELRNEGYRGQGTIVAGDIHIAGNLRVQFPDARIVTPRYWEVRPPAPARPGACLIVWNEDSTAQQRERLDALLNSLNVPVSELSSSHQRVLKIPLPPRIEAPQRQVVVRTRLLPQGQGDCR